MKTYLSVLIVLGGLLFFLSCEETANNEQNDSKEEQITEKERPVHEVLGYDSKVAYGKHLVTIVGCQDCHTPKVMTKKGMRHDTSRAFMGHPAELEAAKGNWQPVVSKGDIVANQNFTAYVGPWGISYAANITSDPTGIGNWTKEQFFNAMRKGMHKGLKGGRMILPPMPWINYRHMTDAELDAIFAYLQSVAPIENQVPQPEIFEKPKPDQNGQ